MAIQLPYGKIHLNLDLPPGYNVSVIEPGFIPALPNPDAALRQALLSPIGAPALPSLVKYGQHVGIIFNDITRATPNSKLLHALLGCLPHIPPSDITLFNALGTHRPNTTDELRAMLGSYLVEKYEIVQNNSFDPDTQVHIGLTSRGNQVWINRRLHECDVKILTGFIEPHIFAGFSGGGKAIMPGLSGNETIFANHCAANLSNPRATWGLTQGNPVFEEVREIALMAGANFLLNVTQNKDKEITGIYCGNLVEAHAQGCAAAKASVMVNVPEPFDIVITTNSGYPLDQNLYQSIKGMSVAAQIVRPGGAIIIAAACTEGIPDHGLYRQILSENSSPQQMLDNICSGVTIRHDQWQAQLQAQVQVKADVYVYSDGLTDDQIRQALLLPCRNIEETVAMLLNKYGPRARICVLPEGPQTIPCLAI